MKKIMILLLFIILASSKLILAQSVFINGYTDPTGIVYNITPTTGLAQMSTGEYIFCNTFGYVLKTDNNGTPIWTKMLMTSKPVDIVNELAVMNSSNELFICGKKTAGDTIVLVKANASGDIVWSKFFSAKSIFFNRLAVLNNGDIMVLGQYNNVDLKAFAVVIRLSAITGNVIWQKVFLHPYYDLQHGHGNSKINDVTETATHDLIFCGVARNTPGVLGNFILKTDPSGTIIWAKSLTPFVTTGLNEPFRIKSLSNGNIKVVLLHPVQGPTSHVGFAEFDAGGNELNAYAFNDTIGNETNEALIEAGGNIAIEAGKALYYFDASSSLQFAYTYLPQYSFTSLQNILRDNSGGLILGGGYSNGQSYFADALLVKTDAAGQSTVGRFIPVGLTSVAYSQVSTTAAMVDSVISIQSTGTVQLAPFTMLKDTVFSFFVGIKDHIQPETILNIYPNPASDDFTIYNSQFEKGSELKIFDVMGKEIFSTRLTNASLKLQAASFDNGMYMVQIKTENKTAILKLIINK